MHAYRLTEWLVRTLLLVSVEEYSNGSQAERLILRTIANRC